jgi:chemotaxis protein methyltransferase CheR
VSTPLPDLQLRQLSDFIGAAVGLDFPRERWRDLERGIGAAARELGYEDASACIQWLVSSTATRAQLEVLASHLTVGETYFFREKRSFEVLEEEILPELIHSRRGTERRLRLWSAGCCTGEEPYSLAILLDRLIPDILDWQITILGTDLNPRFLRKARQGIYTQWSFRDTPAWVKERYFAATGDGRYELVPEIRRRVTFSCLNLAEDAYPSLATNTNGVDLVLCRNVLMYFVHAQAERVVEKLHRSLVQDGWLLVSSTETSQALFPPFTPVGFPGVVFYRKKPKAPRTMETALHPVPAGPSLLPWNPREVEGQSVGAPAPVVAQPLPLSVQVPQPAALPPTPFAEAVALQEQGRYTEAEAALLGPFGRGPTDPKGLALMARLCADQGRLVDAQTWCEQAVAGDRLNPGGYYLLTTILQEQDRAEEAVAAVRQALYLDPGFVLAYVALGDLARRQGKSEESRRYWATALALLGKYRPEEVLPESDGMAAGRLAEIIRSSI